MHQLRIHAYRTLALATAVAALVLATGPSTAKAQDHAFLLTYYSNAHKAGAPDGTLRLTNDGNASESTLCANIYVFRDNEEMEECCSCPIRPNTLLTLSVNGGVTGNPTTGRVLTRGLIEVVSSLPTPVCNAAAVSPKAGIRGWLTHPEAVGANGQYSVNVEQLTESTPGSEELNTLVLGCEILSTLSVGTECLCNDAGR